ncbi:MAG: amidohydrolase [Gammaproteobacteria bacterium]|nr:amidohydrolase [Gammaproteobacteria bacterium]MDH3507395.1 amidohydrolase [Gammaproteobacteria bacterium]
MKRQIVTFLAAWLFGAPLLLQAQQAAPDLILTNGKIITVDDQFRIAEAVAVRGDRIVAVGTTAEINDLAGAGTQRIDLEGRSVVPGLIDNHAHFMEEGAYWNLELRFDGVESRREALNRLRAKAAAVPDDQWIFNFGGWSPDQFVEDTSPFTRDELDQYSGGNPVYLVFSRSDAYINSRAIELIDLEDMNEPWIARDANGRATGQILGPRGASRVRALADFIDAPNGARANLPYEVVRESSLAMLHDLAAAGLTSSGGGCQWDDLYRELQEEGLSSMRFFCMQAPSVPRGDPNVTEKMIAAIPSMRWHDGDNWMTNTTWGEQIPGGGGDDLYSATQQPVTQAQWDQYGEVALEIAKAGIQTLIHTQTDIAIEGKLRQIERINETVPLRPLRWGLMHMEQVTVDQMERMRDLNMFIAVHPREIVTGGLLHRVWGDRAYTMPMLREIQDSGIKWGLGTDAFEVNQYRPFQTLYWAVTGKMVGGTVINHHPVTREEALIAHTKNNAYLFFRENELGSIQAGYLADLVVLDRDYLTIPADEIKDINPVLTMVGGRVVYDIEDDG